MRIKPPCYDEINDRDCPDRQLGCRSTCERWKEWTAIHNAEVEAVRAAKTNEADGFMVERKKRKRAETMRKYQQKRRSRR